MLDQLLKYDTDLFLFLNNLGNTSWDGFWRYVADGCGRFGYFSAHAASSMAAAVFLGLSLQKWYKYLPFLLLFWAVITGYSRIYLGVHYPLDVISGMAFGGLTGWLFYLIQKWGQRKFKTQKT